MASHRLLNYRFWIVAVIGALLFYTVASTSILSIDLADWGLIKRLPESYWIGLVLLGVLWCVSRRSTPYLAVALAFTVAFLFVVPAIVRVPVWISQSYYPFGESMLINSSGHLTYRPTAIFKSYHYWPSFLYLASAFTLVTGLPHDIILKYFPLLVVSLYGLLAFLILRVKLQSSYSIYGAAWLLGCFFLRQQYFGPPSIAYVFFLIMLLFVLWIFFDEERRANRRSVIVLLFFTFAVTTFTHVLTAFMVIVVLMALYLARSFLRFRGQYAGPRVNIMTLSIFFVVIFFSYNMLFVPDFFDWSVRVFSKVFIGSRELGIYSEPERILGSTSNLLNYTSTLAIVLMNGALVLIGLVLAIRNSQKRAQTFKREFFIFCILLLGGFGVFALTAEYGPHEAYQRAFMFGLLPISYLCLDLLSKRPRILPVLLVGILFLNIPAQYGSDSFTLATDTELAGAEFFATHVSAGVSLVHKQSMYVRFYAPEKDIRFLFIGSLPPTHIPNASEVEGVIDRADYFMLSELQNNYYEYFLGVNPLDQVDFARFNRVYDDGCLQMFTHTNATYVQQP